MRVPQVPFPHILLACLQLYLVLDLMETDLHRLLKSLKSRGDHLTPTHTYGGRLTACLLACLPACLCLPARLT